MRPRVRNRNRRGIALVAALSLIALLGLLVAGAVAATTLAQRSSSATLYDGPLAAAADESIGVLLRASDSLAIADLPPSQPTTFDFGAAPWARVRSRVTATRLAGEIVWLVAESLALDDSANRRRVGVVARFPVAGPVPPAAIVSGSTPTLQTDVSILADSACGAGNIPESYVTTDSITLYAVGWQRAALDSAPNVWHVRRDTTLGPVSYEGVLLVDGDLTTDGPVAVRGLLIVRGALRSAGGLSVVGAIVVGGQADLSGGIVRYSACAAGRALRRAAPLRAAHGRRWAELF